MVFCRLGRNPFAPHFRAGSPQNATRITNAHFVLDIADIIGIGGLQRGTAHPVSVKRKF